MGLDISLKVEGVKPADDKFRQMLAAYRSCVEAGVAVPGEVLEYFDGREPVDDGVVVELLRMDVHRRCGMVDSKTDCCVRQIKSSRHSGCSQNGYVIDLAKIPKDVKLLRVFTDANW